MATEKLSIKLYEHLCSISGSENVVRKRRIFFKTLDSAWNSAPSNNTSFPRRHIRAISSGSKAEGLDFNGSDFDLMLLMKNFPVQIESNGRSSACDIIVDINHSSPGFALLKVHTDLNKKLTKTVVFTDCGNLLSSDKFKKVFESFCNFVKPDQIRFFVKHGPCLSRLDILIDIAPCLQCQIWPPFALEWVARPRSKWPSVNQISQITEQGVLFVPIGDSDKPETNPHEWRISFSMAEKLLIHALNHTQLLCYVLLKFVLKEIININSDSQNLLCSYFMKTVLFWEIETNRCLVWEPKNILQCYKQCFRRLMYFVRCGYCPNYFMPENNMFRNKIFGRAKDKLEVLLNCLMSEGIMSFLRSESLKDFPSFELSRNIDKKEETNRAIVPLMNILNIYLNINETDNEKPLSSLLTKIRKANERKSTLVSELLLLYLAQCFGKMSVQMKYDFRIKNKKLYIQRKTCLSHLLIGKSIDNVSGWLQIAAFLYQHKQYDIASVIAEYALTESLQDKILVSQLEGIDNNKITQKTLNLSFLRTHKLLCMYNRAEVVLPHSFLDEGDNFVMNNITTSETCINHFTSYMSQPQSVMHTSGIFCGFHNHYKALITHTFRDMNERWSKDTIKTFVPPIPAVFGRYLRLLCFLQLHKTRLVRQEMYELRAAVDEHRSSDINLNVVNYYWLFKAMDLLGDHEQIVPSFYKVLDDYVKKTVPTYLTP